MKRDGDEISKYGKDEDYMVLLVKHRDGQGETHKSVTTTASTAGEDEARGEKEKDRKGNKNLPKAKMQDTYKLSQD